MFTLRNWLFALLIVVTGGLDVSSAQRLPVPSPAQLRQDSVLTALRRAGVDTIYLYSSGCPGCQKVYPAHCVAASPTEDIYVFWRQHQRTYRLYLSSCRLRPAAAVCSDLWLYFAQHPRPLRTETIRPFRILAFPWPQRVGRNHGSWRKYQIFLPHDTICRVVSSVDLKYRTFDLRYATQLDTDWRNLKRPRNLNYRHNSRTHVYHFLELLLAATKAPPLRQD